MHRTHAQRLVRLVTPLLLAVVALINAGCTPEDPFVTTDCARIEQHKGAFLRVIHVAPDGPGVYIYVGGTQALAGLQEFLSFQQGDNEGKYYPVDGGTQKISFRTGSTSLADTTASLASRGYYTAYFYGSPGNYHVLLTSDDVANAPDLSHSRYRIVHLSPDAGTVNIEQYAGSNSVTVAQGLTYGHASDYYTTETFPLGAGPGLRVKNASNGSDLYSLPEKYINFPGTAILTVIMTGKLTPSYGEPFIFFSAMQENSLSGNNCLYGIPPLRIEFGALRAVNLMPTGPVGAGPDFFRLDFSIYDPNRGSVYSRNDYFRRELTLSHRQVLEVYSFEHRDIQPYFLVSTFGRSSFPYRVEKHGTYPLNSDDFYHGWQQPVASGTDHGGIPLKVLGGQRFTLVAYGPFDPASGRSIPLRDDDPVSPGKATIRFFHGAYDFGSTLLQGKRLRLRLKGSEVTSPALGYGDTASGAAGTFMIDPGSELPFQVIDETGTVVHEQTLSIPNGNLAYTVFLFPGADGNKLMLKAASEAFDVR